MSREFVAYNDDGDVVVSREAKRSERLEHFATDYPHNDVAEVENGRETRTFPKVEADRS